MAEQQENETKRDMKRDRKKCLVKVEKRSGKGIIKDKGKDNKDRKE